MQQIYLDNAATAFPKAPGVSNAMKYYLDAVGANINRIWPGPGSRTYHPEITGAA